MLKIRYLYESAGFAERSKELDVYIENNMQRMIWLKHCSYIRTYDKMFSTGYIKEREHCMQYNSPDTMQIMYELVICIGYNANNVYIRYMHRIFRIL